MPDRRSPPALAGVRRPIAAGSGTRGSHRCPPRQEAPARSRPEEAEGLSPQWGCYASPVQPEVAKAIGALVAGGVLAPERAAPLLRIARGELVSVRAELRALLWAGVSLVMAGVGMLVKQNLAQIGPLAIVLGLGLASAACLAWVASRGPAFSWGQQASPNLAFDYVLLLGASLAGADLAFVEIRYAPLGGHWPSHLLVSSLLAAVLATRYDSRVLFSLALTTFAAWRGVTASSLSLFAWHRTDACVIRANTIACGALFIGLGALLLRLDRKAHFEPVAAHIGWGLLLGALAQGALQPGHRDAAWPAWAAAAIVTGVGLAALGWRGRRLALMAMGVLAAYLGLSRLVVEPIHGDSAVALYFVVTGAALVAALVWAQRRLAERP